MGFTRLSSLGVVAVKGRWATMMNGAMQAAIATKSRQEAAGAAPHAAGSAKGKAALVKNKEALAKALAGLPASAKPRLPGSRSIPVSATANKARLDALLVDND